jgi:CHASE3 domain sensor protein
MRRNWTFGRKLASGFALIVLLNLLTSAIAVYGLRTVISADDRVIHTNAKILTNARELESISLERVSANRGYLLSGDEQFRAILRDARGAFDRTYAESYRLVSSPEENKCWTGLRLLPRNNRLPRKRSWKNAGTSRRCRICFSPSRGA